jgi:hypothetical protein
VWRAAGAPRTFVYALGAWPGAIPRAILAIRPGRVVTRDVLRPDFRRSGVPGRNNPWSGSSTHPRHSPRACRHQRRSSSRFPSVWRTGAKQPLVRVTGTTIGRGLSSDDQHYGVRGWVTLLPLLAAIMAFTIRATDWMSLRDVARIVTAELSLSNSTRLERALSRDINSDRIMSSA